MRGGNLLLPFLTEDVHNHILTWKRFKLLYQNRAPLLSEKIIKNYYLKIPHTGDYSTFLSALLVATITLYSNTELYICTVQCSLLLRQDTEQERQPTNSLVSLLHRPGYSKTRGLQRLLETLVCKHLQPLSVKKFTLAIVFYPVPCSGNTLVNKVRYAQLGIEWMDRCSVSNYSFPDNCKMLTSF